jgi:hypothetical protein
MWSHVVVRIDDRWANLRSRAPARLPASLAEGHLERLDDLAAEHRLLRLALKRQDNRRVSIDRDRRGALRRDCRGQAREQIGVVWDGEREASGIHRLLRRGQRWP